MLLKLDHVSYSCGRGDGFKKIIPTGYKEQFREEGLPNIECKCSLLKHHDIMHNIIMYLSDKDYVPIEITQYETVSDIKNKMNINGSEIIFFTQNVNESKRFFSCFDMKTRFDSDKLAELYFQPFLDSHEWTIRLCKNDVKEEAVLDICGFSSIGIIVDKLEKVIEKVKIEGFITTGISQLLVNGKLLEIAFCNGFYGEVVELISFSKR